MTLGEKIQELRRRYSMSQDVLAERLEVSRQAVSKWERDEAMPETDKVIRLAQLFGVSTDYLLREEQPLPPPNQEPPRGKSAGDRLERFIRRHGYKAGYFMVAGGALLCVIALLVMLLIPGMFSAVQSAGGSDGNSWNSGLYIEGNVSQEVLDQIYGQAGAGMNTDIFGSGIFGSMEDEYNQDVEQMHSAWLSSMRMMAAMFGVPVLLIGVALIVLGSVIIVKGKKLAAQTP